jgi:hypothetical protein
VQLLIRGEMAAMPLKGVVDLAAERARLEKELAKVDADIERVDKKLGNPKFVENADEEVVEGEREKREEAVGRRAKILEAVERLKGAAREFFWPGRRAPSAGASSRFSCRRATKSPAPRVRAKKRSCWKRQVSRPPSSTSFIRWR